MSAETCTTHYMRYGTSAPEKVDTKPRCDIFAAQNHHQEKLMQFHKPIPPPTARRRLMSAPSHPQRIRRRGNTPLGS